jgi:hypothetical protein
LGLGFGVWGFGFWGSGFGVRVRGFGVSGFGVPGPGPGFWVLGLGFREGKNGESKAAASDYGEDDCCPLPDRR